MIRLTRSTFNNPKARKKFIADVCKSINEYLSSDKEIQVVIDSDVDLRDAGDALRNIAEILDTAGSLAKKDDEDIDDADFWKYQD